MKKSKHDTLSDIIHYLVWAVEPDSEGHSHFDTLEEQEEANTRAAEEAIKDIEKIFE